MAEVAGYTEILTTGAVFKPSDFPIINTDGNSDFDVEDKLVLRDANGRKLDLKLNYMYVLALL